MHVLSLNNYKIYISKDEKCKSNNELISNSVKVFLYTNTDILLLFFILVSSSASIHPCRTTTFLSLQFFRVINKSGTDPANPLAIFRSHFAFPFLLFCRFFTSCFAANKSTSMYMTLNNSTNYCHFK